MFKKLSLIFFSSSIFLASVSASPKDELNKDEAFLFGYFAGSLSKSCVLYEMGILDKYETIDSIKGTIKLLNNKEYNSVKNHVKDFSLQSPCSKLMLEIWY
tara:strand:+ start:465 stop:767 length:303 start_codon:yes stop_codon:yes gene_type:complete